MTPIRSSLSHGPAFALALSQGDAIGMCDALLADIKCCGPVAQHDAPSDSGFSRAEGCRPPVRLPCRGQERTN